MPSCGTCRSSTSRTRKTCRPSGRRWGEWRRVAGEAPAPRSASRGEMVGTAGVPAAEAGYRRGDGLAGKVWESGAPVSVTDLATDESPRSVAAVAAGLKGIVGFPVRSGRRVVGMIALHTWAPRELDDGLLAVMSDVGSQIAEFVERKRAELALQETEKRMRSVLDNVSDGLATIEQSGVIESANPPVAT